MGLSAKLIRAQLNFFKPFVAGCSLETTRRGQDKLGELMEAVHRHDVIVQAHDFESFEGAWVMPKEERRSGVILYLHGGGYTCGDIEYAKGFASTLASECGVRVFCAAYRLAPETRFPGALDDAEESYRYLLSKGFEPEQICLCGESAGGGLLRYLRRGHFFIFGGAFILTGLYNVLIEYLLNVTFKLHEGFIWSIYPLAVCILLGITLIVIGRSSQIRRSLHKRFFL